MKQLLSIATCLLFSLHMWAWKPLMVGHRGCSVGVENTRESFIHAATVNGYDGIECDVRVTKDGVYVISHDETTTRLGGNLSVADATYEALSAESFTQTRSGVTYTGKICTVAEYLDICIENNVFPVIELKWTTGINNNDMSNFPGLMKLVTDKKLENKAIFLTSMQNSLLYIRKNYPDVKCQFLCNSLAESKVDWCRDNGIEPSISVGYFDQQLLLKYHNAGMRAACWVVDSEANYKKYAEMGVYMITTNSLIKSSLPEVTPVDWDAITEIPDPINISFTEVWSRTLEKDNLPTNFPSGNNATYKTGQQAAFVDGKFLISDYGTGKVLTIDKDCDEATVADGYPMHGITTDDAGNLIQRGESSYTALPSIIYITKKGEAESTKIEFSIPSEASGQTNFISATGDIFSSQGGCVFVYPNKQTIVYTIHIANGELVEVKSFPNLSIEASTAGIVIPCSSNDPSQFIYMVRNQGFYRYNNSDEGALLTSANSSTPAHNSSLGGAYFVLDNHEILVHPSGKNYSGGFSIKDITAGNVNLATVDELGTTSRTTTAYSLNPSCGTFFRAVANGENTIDLYFYTMGFGYGLYRITAHPAGVECINNDNTLQYFYQDKDRIKIVNAQINGLVQLYNINGTLVTSQELNPDGIVDLGNLSRGIYILTTGTQATKIVKH